MNRLKKKWGITSNYQIMVILLVFSITGSIAVVITNPVLKLIGLNEYLVSPWIFWPIRIFIIFPIYQVLIVVIGALF